MSLWAYAKFRELYNGYKVSKLKEVREAAAAEGEKIRKNWKTKNKDPKDYSLRLDQKDFDDYRLRLDQLEQDTQKKYEKIKRECEDSLPLRFKTYRALRKLFAFSTVYFFSLRIYRNFIYKKNYDILFLNIIV